MSELLEQIDQRLRRIEEMLLEKRGGELLDVDGAAKMTGYSKSHIYKLSSERLIPHFKLGSRILFNEDDLKAWMTQDRVKTKSEIRSDAETYCATYRPAKQRPKL